MRRHLRALVGASTLALVLAACAPAEEGTQPAGDATQGNATGTTDAATPSETPGGAAATSSDTPSETDAASGSVPTVDGSYTYAVHDAGAVTFSVADGRLTLDSVEARDGWSWDDDSERNEIDIDFAGPDSSEADIEIEMERGVLEIEIDTERAAVDGPFEVSLPDGAGTVRLAISGGSMTLDAIEPGDGWEVTREARPGDEVEVRLANADGSVRVELEAEVDDGELEVDLEVRRYPAGR